MRLAEAAWRGTEEGRIIEVILIYRIISTLRQKGENVDAVARRLGLGDGYSYEVHLKNGLSSFISESDKKKNDNEQKNIVLRNFTTLGIVLHTQYTELTGVYGKLLELYPEVDTAFDILQTSIKEAGGWQSLQATMQKNDPAAAGILRNQLADVALVVTEKIAELQDLQEEDKADLEEDIAKSKKRITEVVLLYRIISTIQQEEGEYAVAVASRLGLGWYYSYEGHLKNGLSSFISESDKKKNDNEQKNIVLRNLTTLGIVLHAQYADVVEYVSNDDPDNLIEIKLTDVYDKLLELYPEVEDAFDILQTSIKAAGGWQVLQAAMQKNNPAHAGQFRNELAKAALRGTEEGRITEVILIYSIISTIQQQEGGTVKQVASRLGLGDKYSYTKHLRDGREFDLGKLQKKLGIELAKWKDQYSKENYKLLQNIINECMPRLHKLHAPQYKLPQLEQAEQMELPFAG